MKMKRKERIKWLLAFGGDNNKLEDILRGIEMNCGCPVTAHSIKECVNYNPATFKELNGGCPGEYEHEVDECWIKWLGPKNMKILKEIYE